MTRYRNIWSINRLMRGIKTERISEDLFMFQGDIGMRQWLPSHCNTFLLRDEERLVLYDTGAFEDIRSDMLSIIREYEDVCSSFYLVNGHADLDHIGNNDILDDVKIEDKHFLIHERGFPRLNAVEDDEKLTKEIMEYYDFFGTLQVPIVRFLNKISPRMNLYFKRKGMERYWTLSRTKESMAEHLRDSTKQRLDIAGRTFQGWQIGNIYLIHDGAHAPEHLCLYDTKRRALLVGDLAGEWNPMFSSETNGLIEYCNVFAEIAKEGYTEILGGGHRNKHTYKRIFDKHEVVPFTQYQISDCLQGKDKIAEFFQGFSNYYREIRDTILDVHKNLGSATIEQIVKELRKSDSKAIQMKMKLEFPRFISWIRTSIASILREIGARKTKIGNKIIFEPEDIA